jgi:hypothetical protein
MLHDDPALARGRLCGKETGSETPLHMVEARHDVLGVLAYQRVVLAHLLPAEIVVEQPSAQVGDDGHLTAQLRRGGCEPAAGGRQPPILRHR